MAPKRVTIKDVAAVCDVSIAVASAALRNQRGGSIRYSPATREKVLQAAARLHYRLNRLASAMRSGLVPVVAVSLHASEEQAGPLNLYLHDAIPAAAFALHRQGFELLFLPFTNHAEQAERLRFLVEDRLIGGVVSNFLSGAQDAVGCLLHDLGVPFVLMGSGVRPDFCSVPLDEREYFAHFLRLAQQRGLHRSIHVDGGPGESAVRWREWPTGAAGVSESTGTGPLTAEDTQVVVTGDAQYEQLQARFRVPARRLLVVEDARLPVRARPAVLVQSAVAAKTEKAVALIADSLRGGPPPRPGVHPVGYAVEKFQYLPG
jgi:LacI family transcriptional regulator